MGSRTRTHIRRGLAAAIAVALVATGSATLAPTAAEAAPGTITTVAVPSDAVGTIDAAVYLPPGYDASTESYPSLYLLHGRGDTLAAWQRVSGQLDALIADGSIPPMVVVMPDAPWNDRGGWYTDSAYTGAAPSGPGLAVETAFADDLVAFVDATFRTVPDRAARAVGGYSMGGAGALRLVLAHQETFSAGIVLSPAVYVPQPPADSSVRDYGAYGVGDALFDEDRFAALSYPAALAEVDPALPVHLFVAVGDDEYANPDPAEAIHDLQQEAATLYTAARRVPGVTAELRVLDGGHDWDVWEPAFREGIVDVASRLRTSPLPEWDADLVGSAGDDRAGGIVAMPDGGTVVALAVAAPLADVPHRGGLDVVVQRRDDAGEVLWSTPLATPANDRAYGVVAGADGSVLVAGYTRGDLDGEHPSGASDDGFVASVDSGGVVRWVTQLGDAGAADRFYAIASDGAGGAWVTGYSSGAFAQAGAGDKDVVVVHVAADGSVAAQTQIGGAGEDKGQAIAVGGDGAVMVGGVTGAALPGATAAGSTDGFVLRLAADATVEWTEQLGTAEADQVWGVVPRADGSVVAIGSTRGTLGEAALGDHDILVHALDAAGEPLWTTQLGTATDDRGIAGVLGADGGVMVVGATYGAIGEAVGSVDVVAIEVDAAGAAGAVVQLGSVQRDGADEFDDPNLFAAAGSVLLTGLTYGAPAGTVNAGAADVFLAELPYDAAAPAGPGDGGPGDGGPGTGEPTPSQGGVAPTGGADPSAGGGGALPTLGAGASGAAALLAMAVVALGALLWRRRELRRDPLVALHR